MNTKPHILFVDDEDYILQGLKRGMRRHREKWQMDFANSGAQALEVVGNSAIDIIVTDMQMPKMDGAELLERVRDVSPDTARVVLSGYAKDEVILKVIGPAHQYLAKPSDFVVIEDTLQRILQLRQCIGNETVRKIITGKTNLPSLPDIYSKLLAELENPISTNKTIANILEHDISLKAQVLKVCNSAFFGLPQKVNSLEVAVSLLGLNTLRSMTLLNGFFSTLNQSVNGNQRLAKLTVNCIDLALVASKIAKISHLDKHSCDLITSAGSLSHIGSLLIAATWPEQFEKAGKMCEHAPESSIDTFERELIGADHGIVGAYLLGLWGFPLTLCEAVAYHHRPELIGERKHPVLACLHIAQHVTKAIAHNNLDITSVMGNLDVDFLEEQGLSVTQDMLDKLVSD